MTILYDISQTLRPDLPVWPGDTPFNVTVNWAIDENCPVLVSRLTLSTHSGSHADAPSHYDPAGKDMAQVGLQPYLGLCTVIEAPEGMDAVSLADIMPQLEELQNVPKRLLIRTFDRFPHENWPADFRAIDADLIHYLGENGCLLIGTDTPSLDPQTSKTMDAHNAIRVQEMAILEGLVLDGVPAGEFELIALPLKIKNADASPVRALLRELTNDV